MYCLSIPWIANHDKEQSIHDGGSFHGFQQATLEGALLFMCVLMYIQRFAITYLSQLGFNQFWLSLESKPFRFGCSLIHPSSPHV